MILLLFRFLFYISYYIGLGFKIISIETKNSVTSPWQPWHVGNHLTTTTNETVRYTDTRWRRGPMRWFSTSSTEVKYSRHDSGRLTCIVATHRLFVQCSDFWNTSVLLQETRIAATHWLKTICKCSNTSIQLPGDRNAFCFLSQSV